MSDEKQRNLFEAWFCGPEITRKLDREGGGYKFMAAHSAWQTWQAALASQPKPAPVLPEPKLQEIHNPQTGERQLSDHGSAYYGTNWRVVRNLYTEEEVVAIFNKLTAVTK